MHSRNAGLQRLRATTKRVGVAAAVLTGVFAGLAAAANSGKHHRRTAVQSQQRTRAAGTTRAPAPAPPSLPAAGDEGTAPAPAPPPAPSPPQQPPAPTEAPPAATSGGS